MIFNNNNKVYFYSVYNTNCSRRIHNMNYRYRKKKKNNGSSSDIKNNKNNKNLTGVLKIAIRAC